jgi:hypothetical protein
MLTAFIRAFERALKSSTTAAREQEFSHKKAQKAQKKNKHKERTTQEERTSQEEGLAPAVAWIGRLNQRVILVHENGRFPVFSRLISPKISLFPRGLVIAIVSEVP